MVVVLTVTMSTTATYQNQHNTATKCRSDARDGSMSANFIILTEKAKKKHLNWVSIDVEWSFYRQSQLRRFELTRINKTRQPNAAQTQEIAQWAEIWISHSRSKKEVLKVS